MNAPEGQYVPTVADSKSIATSGALPLRIAATIFAVATPPATSTWTSGCFASYSASVFFTTSSSRAAKGSQTVSLTGPPVLAEVAPAAATATTSAATRNTRGARRPILHPPGRLLVNFPNLDSTTGPKPVSSPGV